MSLDNAFYSVVTVPVTEKKRSTEPLEVGVKIKEKNCRREGRSRPCLPPLQCFPIRNVTLLGGRVEIPYAFATDSKPNIA